MTEPNKENGRMSNSNAAVQPPTGETFVAKAAAGSSTPTGREMEVVKGIVKFLRETFPPDFLEKHVEPLLKSRERRLEARIRELEQRAVLEHVGTWHRSREYYPGQVVMSNGSSWVAKTRHSHGEPGKCDDWQLLVQRGARADSKELMDKLHALEHRLAVLEQRGGR